MKASLYINNCLYYSPADGEFNICVLNFNLKLNLFSLKTPLSHTHTRTYKLNLFSTICSLKFSI